MQHILLVKRIKARELEGLAMYLASVFMQQKYLILLKVVQFVTRIWNLDVSCTS